MKQGQSDVSTLKSPELGRVRYIEVFSKDRCFVLPFYKKKKKMLDNNKPERQGRGEEQDQKRKALQNQTKGNPPQSPFKKGEALVEYSL